MASSGIIQAPPLAACEKPAFLQLTPALRKRIYACFPLKTIGLVWDKFDGRPYIAHDTCKESLATTTALAKTCTTIHNEVVLDLYDHGALTLQLEVQGATLEPAELLFISHVASTLEFHLPTLKTLRLSLEIDPNTSTIVPLTEVSYLSKALKHNHVLESITCIFRLRVDENVSKLQEGLNQLRKLLDPTKSHADTALEEAWDEEPLNMAKILFWRTIKEAISQDDASEDEVAFRATLGLKDLVDEDSDSDSDDEDQEAGWGYWKPRDDDEEGSNEEEAIGEEIKDGSEHVDEDDGLLEHGETIGWCCFQ